jgi:SAM-dependent methyltransferase
MVNILSHDAYTKHFAGLRRVLSEEDAVRQHVGRIENYYVMGAIERRLLEMAGLQPDSYLIDIGCGSGRLAKRLAELPALTYLGIDVVPDVIQHCRDTLPSHWRFEVVTDFAIPESDEAADFVCAFSVFTHLLHEQSFAYIKEAFRVLRSGGSLICSFLEYRNDGHRKIFLDAEKSKHTDRPLIVFTDRECLEFFGRESGFSSVSFIDGAAQYISFDEPEILPDGKIVGGKKAFGQSICYMRKN